MRYRISDLELDDERFELKRAGETVAIEPKALRLLILLSQRHPSTVSKEELVATLWPDVTVTSDALRRAALALRKAIGESPGDGGVVQTVRGRGYRIGVDVDRVEVEAEPEARDASSADRDVFVGRNALLGELRGALRDVERGRGRIAFLAGEPGIGKTRTAEEVAVWARRDGYEVLWGRCLEGKGAPALWPWVQIVRRAVRSRDVHELHEILGQKAADLALLAPELFERFPELMPSRQSSLDTARYRFFDAVGEFLQRASNRRPLLLLLDDLHRADPASLRLLSHVAMELRASRVFLLGTYRDVATPPNRVLDETVEDIAHVSPEEVVFQLEGLTDAQAWSLAEIHCRTAISEAEAIEIRERTSGNPFFVCELARWMRSSGTSRGTTPRSVRGMIRFRLEDVSDAAREMLQVAAVIGRRDRIEFLATVLGTSEEEVMESVEEAERAGLLQPTPGDPHAFEFAHALVMETVYALLPRVQRARLHRLVAESIETFYERALDAHLASLAYHYGRAVGTDSLVRSVDYEFRAGQRAERQLAFEDALEHYRRVVRALEDQVPNDPLRQCEALLAIARLEEWSGNRDAQVDACVAASEIARRLDRPDLFASAALSYSANSLRFGHVDESAVLLLEEGIRSIGEDDTPVRARLLASLADQLAFDDLERRETLLKEARRIANAVGDERLRFEVSGEDLGMEHWTRLAEERVSQARRIDPEALFAALLNRGTVRFYIGDVRGFRADYAAAGPLADELGGWKARYWPMMGRAAIAILEGRFDEAERMARDALSIGRAANQEHLAHFGGQMNSIRYHRGELRSNRGMIDLAEQLSDPMVSAMVVSTLVAEGNREAAEDWFERLARKDFSDVPTRPIFVAEHWEYGWPTTMCLLAEAAVALGDEARAEILYELMRPYAGFHGVLGDYAATSVGGLDLRLGMLATLLGEFATAQTHLDEAQSWAERVGARPWEAHTLLASARMRLARNEADDFDGAVGEGRRALGLARSLGMARVERDLLALFDGRVDLSQEAD